MSIHRVSPLASKAAAVLALVSAAAMLSTTAAESTAEPPPSHAAASAQKGRAVGACRVIDRPKHKIVYCGCANDPLAGVESIDVAAMLRLIVGSPKCRAQAAVR